MNIKELVSKMTLEEKAEICSGYDFWNTNGVKRLNVPKMMVSDGPHGLRKQDQKNNEAIDHLGINDSIKAVCFPAGCATASSFDKDLIEEMGKIIGNECQAENVGVVLGPAVNIKRSPLCGRNFEYYSEDPYLTSEIATGFINGVQSKNVGTSIKHFLANNQEHRRMSSSSEVDERTLREIYLAAFEGAVKNSKPWTVMCSYNRINGIYAAENKRYLTEILRDEWGFDGFVVSDWGAVNDRVPDLEAGLDLEMPLSHGMGSEKIIDEIKKGNLKEEVLDLSVERILNIVYRFYENKDETAVFDKEKDHESARNVASQCMVLLKNDDILPLDKNEKTAFIGYFAEKPRFQGGGSSHINCFKVESAMDMAPKDKVLYAKGYELKDDVIREDLINEAVEIAKQVKTAVVFAGLPDELESEGYDREHMKIPNCQNRLIHEVAKANPNTVVVLHNGSPVEMPWVNDVKGILEVYLGGQAVGGATIDVLYGDVNPSGHLAESFPIKLQDNPSYLYYKGIKDKVEYREGVFVGYRYYDKKDMDVLFPFGHGLSYTDFEFSNMKIDKTSIKDNEEVTVSVNVKNIGKVKGKEVVQLYVSPDETEIIRPVRELKGFCKIELNPDETKNVSFKLNKRDFSYYNEDINDWVVETNNYTIELGESSRNILTKETVKVESTTKIKNVFTLDSNIGDVLKLEEAKKLIKPVLDAFNETFSGSDNANEAITEEMTESMLKYMPIRGAAVFGNGSYTLDDAEKLVDKLNKL
jgi:beta-glucosidase